MKIEQTGPNDLITKVKITLESADYLPKYKSELAKLKQKVSLKGFRQGKTPDHVVVKMYGQKLMADVLNDTFYSNLERYLLEQNINYVAQPMIAEGQEMIDINLNNKEAQYEMLYDIGVIENLNIAGVNSSDSYTFYKIQASAADIADNEAKLADQFGEFASVDGSVGEFDKVFVSAVELNEGQPKKDGWQTDFDFFVSGVKEEALKNQIIGLAKGAKLDVKLSDLTRMSAENIRREWLAVDANDSREIGDDFQLTIEDVQRKMPMPFTDEKVSEIFGMHGLNNLEELRARLAENLESSNQQLSIDKLYGDMYKKASEESTMDISDTFLKRWLQETEKLEGDKIDEMFEGFKKDLKWSIVQRELSKKYNVTVTKADMDGYLHHRANEFMQQFGFFDQDIFNKVLDRMRNDQNEMYRAQNIILTNKIFTEVEKNITKIEENITLDAFNKMNAPEQIEAASV